MTTLAEAKFTFFDQCDRFRRCIGGEADWQEMMRRKKRISQSEFERFVDPSDMLDADETLDDWVATSGGTEFFRSAIGDETVYFMQAAGFEFIFRDPRRQESLDEARQHGRLLPEVRPDRYGFRGAKARIYRAVDARVGEFKHFDYVTMNTKFAVGHAEHQAAVTEEPQVVLQARVPAEHVAEARNPGEWFYIGPGVRGRVFRSIEPEVFESLFETVATGNCYEAAANLIWAEATGGGMTPFPDFNSVDSILVHAEVGGEGPIEGLRYGHAWVERGGKVIDHSNGRRLEVPRSVYYTRGKVIDKPGKIYRYTGPEVKRWMQRTQHYGPWELETESGL